MPTQEAERYSLPQLQKRILNSLAGQGPQTRNEIKKNVKSAYKNILFSTKSMEKKGIIRVVDRKEWMGQYFPKYWLTFDGLFLALIEGSDPKILKMINEELHGPSEDMDLVFELARILPSEELGRVYNSCKFSEGEMEIYLPVPMNPKSAKIWREALKKSPKYQKIIRRTLKQAIDELPKGVGL